MTAETPCLSGVPSTRTIYITTAWAPRTIVWVHITTLNAEKQLLRPMFIRGSPYRTTHITTVWAHTTTVWVHTTAVYTNVKRLSRPHVYQGFPLLNNINNYCLGSHNFVGTHNYSLHYRKTAVETPCLSGAPSIKQYT